MGWSYSDISLFKYIRYRKYCVCLSHDQLQLNVPNTFVCTFAVQEQMLRNSDDFVWRVDTNFYGRFVIDVEFLDLKICSLSVSL